MKNILGILTIFSSLALTACSNHKTKDEFTIIADVHDGDTFTTKENIKIRLFGVDTPESNNQYNDFASTDGLESIYANKAREYVEELINNKRVQLLKITEDRYHRTVARILFNNKDLGIELLNHGLARVAYISVNKKSPFYTSDFIYYQKLLDAQYYAHSHNLGFWKYKDEFKTIFPKA